MDRTAVILPDAEQVCGLKAGVRTERSQSALTPLLFFFVFFFSLFIRFLVLAVTGKSRLGDHGFQFFFSHRPNVLHLASKHSEAIATLMKHK